MKVNIQKVSNLSGLEEVKRVSDLNFGQIGNAINGSLIPNENLQSSNPLVFEITAANQVVSVAHGLSYTPANYWVVFQNAGAVVYAASLAQYPWTKNVAFLTASAPVGGRVIFF